MEIGGINVEKNEQLGVDLFQDVRRCKDICYRYNNLLPSDDENKQKILEELIGKMGKNCTITQPFYCDMGYNIEIGDNFYTNHNCVILDGAKVSIGNNVFIAPNCCISTANHPLDYEQRNKGIEYAVPIIIEDSVWIGASVTILSGVTIGKNSVIGAGSIVTKNIPPNVIAVGNPCKVLRQITDKDRYQP
ncbi:maltose acetyltransferase [Candidatus Epulonipiscium fishelsonii]|uniref:Maltose acetyltransferase n=1 Tax=Candidatus Epulonipiscium fishelsonii TaxID=77094 RepID=A0ACC8X9W2_9FIRM|nr:maltose acetyltransferase [Epulopiscium sp. SCG-B11WGA-EpuloA1]ONI43769.1 maltose acetyltransferase [Epulopiscium sp. SCG-B05WGA-EpuloA1]